MKLSTNKKSVVAAQNLRRQGVQGLAAQELLNNPEWARLPKSGQRLLGFSRSTIYVFATEGSIVTRSLKRPGQKRGMRFVHLPSLAALIEQADS